MKATKQQRTLLREKYGDKCVYCGCDLPDRWHVDHIGPIVRNWWDGTFENPHRRTFENLNPSCPSCNIIKGSDSLEGLRMTIAGFIRSLNKNRTHYKFAKKYRLAEEREIEVKF